MCHADKEVGKLLREGELRIEVAFAINLPASLGCLPLSRSHVLSVQQWRSQPRVAATSRI